jgi:hypothetical protein
MSKLFRRHVMTLETGLVGESFVRAMKMALNASDRREQGYSVSSTAPKLDTWQLGTLLDKLRENPPRIEPKQEVKGLKWLQSRKVQRELGMRERDIVKHFDHFTLSDFYDVGQRQVAFMLPVYTVHAKDGRTFAYYAGSWQSGVPLTVIA